MSKLGLAFDEQRKQLLGPDTDPQRVMVAIENSLHRLQREQIDVMLLHLNTVEVADALALFEQMQRALDEGKIRAYGWSTDFPERVKSVASQPGFAAVEHAMNVFHAVPTLNHCIEQYDLHSLIRSPLAMGVLTGKYDRSSKVGPGDIRSGSENRTPYFVDRGVAPNYLQTLEEIRELLQTGGRSVAQGALCWLWAKSARAIPLPGARSVQQVQQNAGALAFGPLPADVMDEIERLVNRQPEIEPVEL